MFQRPTAPYGVREQGVDGTTIAAMAINGENANDKYAETGDDTRNIVMRSNAVIIDVRKTAATQRE